MQPINLHKYRYWMAFHLPYLLAVVLFSAATAISGFAQQPGDLDPTFGNGGKFTDWSGRANDVAIQPDGKIVVAGSTNNGGSFAVARYNADGSFDPGFGGGDGKVITDIGFSHENANAVAIQADGKIVALGTTWDGSGSQWGHFSLVRYNPDGSVDPAFGGGDGIVVTENLGTGWVTANSVVIQSDGKIVAAGRSDYDWYDSPYVTVIRYNPNGSLDLPFGGGDGIARTPGELVEDATSVALQPDGKIVAAGYRYGPTRFSTVVRFDSNGLLDQTFGEGDGIVFTAIGPDLIPRSVAIAIQSDGKIVTASSNYNGSNTDFALVRYTSDGSLDTTFDFDGKVATPIGSGSSVAEAVVIQSDGKILLAGYTNNGSNDDFALARYDPNGSLDTTFGAGDGIMTVDFNTTTDLAYGMALDNVGRAVVAGQSGEAFALARFLLNPSNTITVTNTNDSGAGSLRQAIADAAPGDTINFNVMGTITLTSGQLVIGKNLTIQGPGAKLLSISGNNASRVFSINSGVTATLDGMTIRDGGNAPISDIDGGGILNQGTLTVSNSAVSENVASCEGCTGGGISNHGTLTVANSIVSGNLGDWGGGLFNNYNGTLTVINSTVSGNLANFSGGGIDNLGTLTVTNSTVSGNTAGYFGGGVYSADGNETFKNTIVAGNHRSNDPFIPDDISGGSIETASHNLIGDAASSGGIQNGVNGNIVGANPLLGPLRNNGGPTMTHALLAGSPAINAGSSCVLTENGCGDGNPALPTDQRGMPRNGAVDIGAFERQDGENTSATPFDFDGDGKADPSVFRPGADGVWYVLGSGAGYFGAAWGNSADRLVAADYDGDGRTDIAINRDGVWYVLNSSGGSVTSTQWGNGTDIPVPADYDGDGKADLAIVRDGVWWILNSNGSGYTTTQWGNGTDTPVPADYDGDGKADLAVVRDGIWYILNSGGGHSGLQWGNGSDKLVPADYDGDGKTDAAIVRDGTWWILNSNGGTVTSVQWGNETDTPVPADYDGDGKADPAIVRDGTWWILQSTGGYTTTQWGNGTDIPIPQRHQ